MKFLFRPLILAGSLLGATTIAAQSQETTTPLQTRRVYELPVRNMPPHLAAWWLDRANQTRPKELGAVLPEEAASLELIAQQHPMLPGIDRIIPLESQHTLLVLGEKQSVRKLREQLALLDKPAAQVEIEIHILSLNPDDVKDFGLNFGPTPSKVPNPSPDAAFKSFPATAKVQGNVSALLAAKGVSITLPDVPVSRAVVRSNMPFSLNIVRSHPAPEALVNSKDLTIQEPPGVFDGVRFRDTVPPLRHLEIHTPLQMKLIPSVEKNITITMDIEMRGQIRLGRINPVEALLVRETRAIKSRGHLEDGETIAIRGLAEDFASAFFAPLTPSNPFQLKATTTMGEQTTSKLASGELVVFLTPRIVRRAQR